MGKGLILEAKRALSLAGWQTSDREVWPGPEGSFIAVVEQVKRLTDVVKLPSTTLHGILPSGSQRTAGVH